MFVSFRLDTLTLFTLQFRLLGLSPSIEPKKLTPSPSDCSALSDSGVCVCSTHSPERERDVSGDQLQLALIDID
jgi:hypothetical protein